MKKIILLLAIIAIAFIAGMHYSKRNTPSNGVEQGTYKGDGFSFNYPTDVFALLDSKISLPPDYNIEYPGIKLIAKETVPKLGKKECWYGEMGDTTICKVSQERGFSFTVIDDSVEHLTKDLDNKPVITVSGKSTIRWQIGVEGDGADMYFISMGPKKTLFMETIYTNWGLPEQFPSKTQFDAILSSLKLQ